MSQPGEAVSSDLALPVRVVIVDDHAMLSEGLMRLLAGDPTLLVIGAEPTASRGIERVRNERPDVVIMDYALPDMDGAAAARMIKSEMPEVNVIMLTGSERPGAYRAALDAGCSAWVRKTRALRDLVDAIHLVRAGEIVVSDEQSQLPPVAELVVHYQPILELVSGRIVGFEALVRWDHPTDGLVPPGRFLPLAEETGYVADIGRHVLERATRDLGCWRRDRSAVSGLWVSVNMSAAELADSSVAHRVREVLDRERIDPAGLIIEITETMLLEDTPEMARNLRGLKDLGVRLALDDFGTAFSSLSYLRRFPFDYIKIDNTFTAELPHKPRAVLLIEAIHHLAAAMGATAIAEGIERSDQAACLMAVGWELGQGFAYSAPVPSDEASRLAAKGVV